MIENQYPDIKLIASKENLGFSRGNNLAINEAQGEYILLLNPDTVVAEDSFKICLDFMDSNPDYGGLGVRMVDGKGKFLPESKRGLPTPLVAFYKLSGLSKLFPKSKRFSKYHAGHLAETESGEIDILSGAYMMMRKEALDKVGLLDETYFMYGEDIDLSYRIQLGGYKNYYCADTTIIHYKGESTKKSSVNYVFVFYKAMVIFAKKHFSGNNALLFSFLINLGIYLRAGAALFTRIIKKLTLPIIDLAYILIGFYALTNYWTKANIEFPDHVLRISIPAYALTWLLSIYFNGGYDKPLHVSKYLKGTIIGTVLLLIIYAVLPKDIQFSRLFIFLGATWVLMYYIISRLFLHLSFGGQFNIFRDGRKSFQVIGDENEFIQVSELLTKTHPSIKSIQKINYLQEDKEVIYCSGSVSYKAIIQSMIENRTKKADFKIKPENRDYFIGSNSIDTNGELYIIDINNLVSTENKRKKRLFDIIVSLAFILTSPIIVWFFQDKRKFYINVFQVFLGQKSFIGFSNEVSLKDVRLPKIKEGLVAPCDVYDFADEPMKEKLNLLYARDYSLRKDLSILWRTWKQLDK